MRSSVILYRHDALLGLEQTPALEPVAARALKETAAWLEHFVSRPHHAVGRPGDVCPWTRRASERRLLLLGSCPHDVPQQADALIVSLMRRFLQDNEALPRIDPSRAIVVVFPEHGAAAEARVVAIHARLKPLHLSCGLMLGEFFPSCDKRGLHNPDFRPLRSPWPLLVIRPMVEADIAFLWDEDRFAQAYLNVHGERGRLRLLQLIEEPGAAFDATRAQALRELIR
jgi:hypothetical protein